MAKPLPEWRSEEHPDRWTNSVTTKKSGHTTGGRPDRDGNDEKGVRNNYQHRTAARSATPTDLATTTRRSSNGQTGPNEERDDDADGQ